MSSSDYTKITLEAMLQNIKNYQTGNPELSAEVQALLTTCANLKPFSLEQVKLAHPVISSELRELYKQEISYVKANELHEVEAIIATPTVVEKPVFTPQPAPVDVPFSDLKPE